MSPSIGDLARRLDGMAATRRVSLLLPLAAILQPPGETGAKRCLRRLSPCLKRKQCCGKASRCATSHGAGTKTCCGGTGAPCASDLTCCITHLCEGGFCQLTAPATG